MIDLVIVNWNSSTQLAEAVSSISQFHSGLVSSVIIVDNASHDNSLAKIEKTDKLPFPFLIERNHYNRGFGAACNQGAMKGDNDYLLFLNPDTRLFESSLSLPLAYMQEPNKADVGICGVQLVDGSGDVSRSCSRFPTYIGFVAHAIGLDQLFPRLGHFMAEWSHDTTQDVDQVIGAFFLVRRELFEALGGFDEQFFVYFEEVDFAYRANKAGSRSVYLADVQAFHAGGGTSNQVKAKRLFFSLRSRLLYAFKHFHLIAAMVVLLTTLFIEPISRSTLAIARRSWSSLTETWQGYGMLWRWLPQWVFKGVTR